MSTASNPTLAAFPNLDPAEQAKQDYQLKLDKERMAIEHSNKRCELALDKLVFAFVLGLFTLAGYWAVNSVLEKQRQAEARALEKFKLDEARQRFFLENRLGAMLNIETAMSEVTGVFFLYSKDRKDAPDDAEREYDKALAKARDTINRYEFLFDVEVRKNLDRYFEIHKAIRKVGATTCGPYREYLSDLSSELDDLCRSVMDEKPLVHLTIADVGFAERDRLTPKELLNKHFGHWKKVKQGK